MKLKEIKAGRWYETNLGTGKVVEVGQRGNAIRIHIVGPIPRGIVNLKPRSVICEVPEPQQKGN